MNTAVLACALGGDVVVPRLIAVESAALIILAATLLVFRTFRDRYLLIWIAGWLAYFVSTTTLSSADLAQAAGLAIAVSHAQFVLAVALFAAAVFVYTQNRRWLPALALLAVATIAYAALRALLWPQSFNLRLPLEIGYRVIAIAAAVRIVRFRRGRGEIGPWLLSLGLVCLHLNWTPVDAHLPIGFDWMVNVLLGLSMLLIVFDDSRMRTRRLGVINALTQSITRAQQHGPMMQTALEELKNLMAAKAAWFRLFEGDKMVMTEHIGLSEDFLRDRSLVAMDNNFERTLTGSGPIVLKTSDADDSVRAHLKKEGFNQTVMVPVLGKKSVIGVLSLASYRRITYTAEELEFLSTSAHQLGLAVENLRLVEQILRSHRQWANTFDSIQDVVLLHDSDFRVMKANHALLVQLGQSVADVNGKTCDQVLPRSSGWSGCPYCIDEQAGLREAPDPCFGGYCMISTSSYVEQGSKQKGTIHVVRDITDRRAAEEKYRLLFQQMQEGVFQATLEGKLLDFNDAFMRMLGYSTREELLAVDIERELYCSPERREAFRREIQTHGYVRNFEVTLRRKDGAQITALENSMAARDHSGQFGQYQGFLLDITEKKRAEDEIRRRNRELNALNAMAVIASQSFDLDEILNLTLRQIVSLLDAESGSFYLCDAGGTTFRRRAGWGQRFGDRARVAEIDLPNGFGELVTRSRTEVITADFLPYLPAPVPDFIRSDGSGSWIWVLLWSKDKPIGIMGISSADSREYTSNDENLLVAIGRQLATTIEKVRLYEETSRAYDDLRRTQEQLLQSEKMSAVGQLISGVAHELNNPLTAILGYAQLLESEGLSERAMDFVGKLFKQAQRTHRVVQNLLSFARQRKPQKQQVNIQKVLDETLALRDYDLKVNNVRLQREGDVDIPAVTADPHQLEQVFLNIINNSVDAMLENGRGGTLKVRIYAQEGRVNAEFHDSGPGIKEPNRIFEPFYTTKSIGKGTGLGLSICYGIVKEHGGEICANNGAEGGAIITVSLPAAIQSAAAEVITAPHRETTIEGRILLLEHEEAVREFERDVLSGAGAEIVTASSADELKDMLAQHEFDALIIDGRTSTTWTPPEIYKWVNENSPALRAHLMFTFSNLAEPELRTFLQENNVPYLLKPFEVSDLITNTRRILQKTRAAGAI